MSLQINDLNNKSLEELKQLRDKIENIQGRSLTLGKQHIQKKEKVEILNSKHKIKTKEFEKISIEYEKILHERNLKEQEVQQLIKEMKEIQKEISKESEFLPKLLQGKETNQLLNEINSLIYKKTIVDLSVEVDLEEFVKEQSNLFSSIGFNPIEMDLPPLSESDLMKQKPIVVSSSSIPSMFSNNEEEEEEETADDSCGDNENSEEEEQQQQQHPFTSITTTKRVKSTTLNESREEITKFLEDNIEKVREIFDKQQQESKQRGRDWLICERDQKRRWKVTKEQQDRYHFCGISGSANTVQSFRVVFKRVVISNTLLTRGLRLNEAKKYSSVFHDPRDAFEVYKQLVSNNNFCYSFF